MLYLCDPSSHCLSSCSFRLAFARLLAVGVETKYKHFLVGPKFYALQNIRVFVSIHEACLLKFDDARQITQNSKVLSEIFFVQQ